ANVLIELTTLNPEHGEPALTFIRQALAAGMDVITANKGPMAHAAAELHTLARQHKVQIRYESAVMDGLPLLNLAQFTLPAVGMLGFRGLLNNTSSIVLSQMEQGASLDDAIRLAQHMGIAEANPWHDLDGWDATMKTTILANALLDAHLKPHMVQRTGIRDLSQDEIGAAAQARTPIRLVCSARITDNGLIATVHPMRLQPNDPLYAGKNIGIISLETEAMGTITLTEHATSVLQTAYGVLSDLIIIQRSR
ncbi:MAG: homoserine dehydrogenase, partial [Ktedonobacteraceae bacterium]